MSTGSRFPNPGYKIKNQSIDLTRSSRPAIDPISGKQLANPGDPNPPQDFVWTVDARQNLYYMGPIPAFYWPRVVTEIDDQQPPLRQFFFRTNNYFGQQLLTDWNGFRFINIKKPTWIDLWNIDIDYLSARTKELPGSARKSVGLARTCSATSPTRTIVTPALRSTITQQYMGYLDIWGLKDFGTDVLGTGYAIVTNGPPGAGKSGIQRYSTPPFQQDRGRFDLRHNQRFLPDDEEHQFEELRLQLEAAYYTDRYFLEEYYKRLHDTGMDQETLAYGIYQKDNQAIDVWTEANPMNWQTETQWLPRVDYYRLGDSLLSDWFSYYQHSGADYATTTTDIMVNNPNLFAFMPYDPVSNTSGVFSAGRFYTNHELDMPLKFFNAVRLVPYVQGSLVGWTDQLGGGPLGHSPNGAMGRAWGGVGMRGEMTFYKKYPHVMSEIMNVHGLNHKISLFADARAAFSNVRLNNIAIQDDLDDNTYEAVRRYLAITTFAGGILPMPYDPRHLLLRQMVSPITGTTDVQGSMDTVMLGLHQRLQTKRGPQGMRRIVDYMTLDATSTFFPNATRDNFGVPWGQTMYNYQWYLGDRTSLVSQGWFEFWKLAGSNPLPQSAYPYSLDTGYNPNGLNIITTGISLARPPRSNIFLGYTIIDSGPIKTSALNMSISYWLTPKWYGTFATSYDFGDATDLGTMFTFTRIGADYLTTIGLSVDPQRMSYQFAVQITPRISPAFRMGSERGTELVRYAVRSDRVMKTMTDPPQRVRDIERWREPAGSLRPHSGAEAVPPTDPYEMLVDSDAEFEVTPAPSAQADRRNARRKLAAGWRGLKAAIRGDSSFFAHFYRGTLIAITAALLGINQWSWCLLLLGACLVLVAELAHSAVDTLARAIGDPEMPRLKTAREIAAAGVLVAAVGSGAVTVLVLSWKFLELLGWRRNRTSTRTREMVHRARPCPSSRQ